MRSERAHGDLVRIRPDVIMTELNDGTGVVLNLQTKFYYTLNTTALAVWRALGEGGSTADAVAERIEATFDVDGEVARRDVTAVLNELAAEGLVSKG